MTPAITATLDSMVTPIRWRPPSPKHYDDGKEGDAYMNTAIESCYIFTDGGWVQFTSSPEAGDGLLPRDIDLGTVKPFDPFE